MRTFTLLLFCTFLAFMGNSQGFSIDPTNQYTGTANFKKKEVQCQILEYGYPEADLDNAVSKFIVKSGYKVNNAGSGWKMVRNIVLPKVGEKPYDFYYKLDGKGKGDKALTKIYVFATEPGAISDKDLDHDGADDIAVATVGAGTFLGTMGTSIGAYDLDKSLATQEEELKKAEKQYSNSVDEGKSLEGKRKDIEKAISDNQADQSKRAQEVSRLKALVEQTKAKKG
jgi:hypothetical protein